MAKKAQQAAPAVNPLDALAQPAKSASKSKQYPVIQATPEVQEAVDRIVSLKAQMTKLEQELAENEDVVIDVVKAQQAKDARAGKFSKSYSVPGIQGNVTTTLTDKWSVTKDPIEQDHIKDITGQPFFDENYNRRRLVELLDPVQTNTKIMTAILKVVTDNGVELKDGIKVTDSLTTKPGLDQRQYQLDDAKLQELAPLCKQNKPSIK